MKLLTLDEASKYLQIHPMTAYRLAREGNLTGAVKVGGQWRISQDALDARFTKAGDIPRQ